MPPLADAMDAVRFSVDRFCLLAGVEALARDDGGGRHDRVRGPSRHGNRRGYAGAIRSEIGYHGGRVTVQRLRRVRDHALGFGELAGAARNLLLEWALTLMVLNVSTRKYHARSARGRPGESAWQCTSKSCRLSRRFVALSRQAKMKAWLASDLSELDLLNPDRGSACRRPCLGGGDRRATATSMSWPWSRGRFENTVVVQALIDNLLARGLDPELPRLFIVDGAKALSKAIRNTFGVAAAIQRCQVHKGLTHRAPAPAFACERQDGAPSGLVSRTTQTRPNAAAQPGPASGA